MTKPTDIPLVGTVDSLLAINGTSSPTTEAKKIKSLEQHARRIIDRSPFCLLATASDEGCDVSPRGDAPGFVHILDDTTLLLPERPGNRIADSMRNIISNAELALLFLIPGMDDTLRVNGKGYVTTHEPYLERLEAAGKKPKLAIVVDIEEIYLHCPKAFIRSSLWDPASFMPRDELPSLGKMLLEQISKTPAEEQVLAQVDQALADDVENNLY